ncbi:MAG: HAMP domain-containing histidine kinase [Myxococcales bacterium]|nr:HAMP domain-containing histidine kinase [Myxococcales bacterium]
MSRWHRHTDRCRKGGRVQGNLRGRLFVVLGVVILLSMGISFGVTTLVHFGSGETPHERIAHLVGARFARVWDDETARATLAEDIAGNLHVAIEVRDANGTVLHRGGRGIGKSHHVEVMRGQTKLGDVDVYGGPNWLLLAMTLAVMAMLLWLASGVLARRLVWPLEQLTQVARDIGDGRLDSRAQLGHAARGEVGHLARSINDMAGRIAQQLADQRALLAAVSHELRTPLGHMRILLEMAEDDENPTKRLTDMHEELTEMDTLVGELLASSRLDFSELQRKSQSPKDVAERALDRKGLPLDKLQVSGDGDAPVPLDPTLVARALANLLDNARKHGGGVDALTVDVSETEVRFAVRDLGAGFDPAAREQLFAPFVSGGSAHSALGLGLSLVRRIAEAHGGSAFAHNRPEGGAEFGFSLPLGTSPADDA